MCSLRLLLVHAKHFMGPCLFLVVYTEKMSRPKARNAKKSVEESCAERLRRGCAGPSTTQHRQYVASVLLFTSSRYPENSFSIIVAGYLIYLDQCKTMTTVLLTTH